MEFVRQLAVVLNPGHSLVRLELNLVVQGIAIREKEVEIAVLIEINRFDPTEAPMRVARREEVPLFEASRALVEIRDDGFMFLRQERHNIRTPVPIQIDDGNMDSAVAFVEDVWLKRFGGNGAAIRSVLQVQYIALDNPAELDNDQIDVAVGIEIGRLYIGGRAARSRERALPLRADRVPDGAGEPGRGRCGRGSAGRRRDGAGSRKVGRRRRESRGGTQYWTRSSRR